MSKSSTPNQETVILSKEEKLKRARIVALLRDRENGWLAFIEDDDLKRCMNHACRASSLSISPEEFAQALFIALLDLNYAESWASMVEAGKFRHKKNGKWITIDSVLGWMKGQFRTLLTDIAFSSYLNGDPRIRFQSLGAESSKGHWKDDIDDMDSEGDNDMKGGVKISDNPDNDAPVLADDERTKQLEEVLRLVGRQPKVGLKYKEVIKRYFIKHDNLERIAADFLKKGWIKTDKTNNPVVAAKKTIQNRTVPKARDLFDKVAQENGFQCRISDIRRRKPERKTNSK